MSVNLYPLELVLVFDEAGICSLVENCERPTLQQVDIPDIHIIIIQDPIVSVLISSQETHSLVCLLNTLRRNLELVLGSEHALPTSVFPRLRFTKVPHKVRRGDDIS